MTVLDADDGQGTVTLLLTDTAGNPAGEDLCRAVENAILRPDAPEERPAPVNARLDVRAPDTVSLTVKATVELAAETTLDGVKDAFLAGLTAYLPTALQEGEDQKNKGNYPRKQVGQGGVILEGGEASF